MQTDELAHAIVENEDGSRMVNASAAAELFYGDCKSEDVQWAVSQLVPQAPGAKRIGLKYVCVLVRGVRKLLQNVVSVDRRQCEAERTETGDCEGRLVPSVRFVSHQHVGFEALRRIDWVGSDAPREQVTGSNLRLLGSPRC